MAHFKEKRLDVAAEASLQPWTACPGTKIAPRQSVCHHHDGAPHGTSRSRMRHCSPTAPQAGAPVNARYFCTSPCGRHGNGHWAQPVCRTKGALGGTAGTALASGAYRMAVATDIAANITFVDRSRKTAGGTHRHGLPHRVGVTLSGSECLILLRDRSRSRDLWKTFPDFSLFHLYY